MNGLNYLSLSERLLARVFSAAYYASMATGVDSNDTTSLCVAVIAGSLAGTTSLFGRQTLVFATPLVALFTWSVAPLAILAASFFGSIVVDGGYFLRGIRQQIRYSIAYNAFTKRSPYYQGGLSRFVDPRTVFGRSGSLSARLLELELHEPTRIAFRYPELAALVFLIIFNQEQAFDCAEAVVAATLALYVLTTFKALRHFGEANRYLEYNLWFLVPLMLAREWTDGHVPIAIAIGYFSWVGLVTLWKYRSWRRVSASFPDRDQLSDFLKKAEIKSNDVVFPIPVPLGAAVCARILCKAIMYQGVAVSSELYAKYLNQPPYLNRDWRLIANVFGATVIVGDRSMVDACQSLMGWSYDFSRLPIKAQDGRYVAYDISDLANK